MAVTFDQLPPGAYNVSVVPSASTDGQTWVTCTPQVAKDGTLPVSYMSCGSIPMRFLETFPQINPGKNEVSWQVQNLASTEQYAGLEIYYNYNEVHDTGPPLQYLVVGGDTRGATQSNGAPSGQASVPPPSSPTRTLPPKSGGSSSGTPPLQSQGAQSDEANGWLVVHDPFHVANGTPVSAKIDKSKVVNELLIHHTSV